jgi:peptide chain release factor 2
MPSSPRWETVFDLDSKENRLKELEAQLAKDGLWDNPDAAATILKERTHITGLLDLFKALLTEVEDNELLLSMALEEADDQTIGEVETQLKDLEKRIHAFSLDMTLDGEEDPNNAIVSINAGAGGTDAQDWAEMMFRMYLRWAEQRGFQTEIIDLQPGDEAGIKSCVFTVKGTYANGYLKNEIGIHRLVRISPFNASGKRQTSFASVFVYPEIDKEIVVEIDEKDLRIDTFRASGAGGQHVNKTSSAVRITHLPTGIVVTCQNERSQLQNRANAMRVLRARLLAIQHAKREEELAALKGEFQKIEWGSQIRSYVLHPYQMVKDHRTDYEVGNAQSVLDGNLDGFIDAYLRENVGE